MLNLRVSRLVGLFSAVLAPLSLAACGAQPAISIPHTVSLARTAAAAANPVTVSPLPGTADASPHTQISFLGPLGMRISAVSVVGSRSGHHSGRVEAYSTATGASFLPNGAFVSGERVRVTARVRLGSSTSTARTDFQVAFQAPIAQTQFPLDPGDSLAVQHYRSAPSLTPSAVRVTTPAQPGATPGDFFLAPYQGKGTAGPMIVDGSGALVWFHPLPAGEAATNFQVAQYAGHPVLTWWQGRILQLGFGQGKDVIYSTSYRPVAVVRAGNGYSADLHEIRIEPDGTAWIDIFDPVMMNLRSAGGAAKGIVNDSIVEQIDIKTGLVMWEWHALGHVPLRDSYSAPSKTGSPWDYIHVNSVDPGSAGDVLLSARNTWQLYDVSIHTGAFRWRFGGKFSNFHAGQGTTTYWQHDAEWQPGGLISVFDNGASPAHERQSRGVLLRLSLPTRTATLAMAFVNPSAALLATSQGNLANLGGSGNWLMGYGGLPNFTEYAPSGTVLFDATLGRGVQNFRTYLAPWSATAPGRPAVAAQRAAGSSTETVQASWNGATDVASWRVLTGTNAADMTVAATVAKSGFQTTIPLSSDAPLVAVAALDASGQVLGTSLTASPSSR